MLTNYLSIFLNGFFLGLFFVLILRKSKFLICKSMPAVGGMAIGLSFALAGLFGFWIYCGSFRQAAGVITASFIILVFGVIDDRRELSVVTKFGMQIIAALLLIFFGVKTQIVYIGASLNMIITLIWLLGITNAFNHLDVMDGLAGSSALIASLAFSFLAILSADMKIIVLALTLSGAILSFLIFNFPPAKIYMGNSGSHLLGFILAAVALIISYASMERKIALLSPILILGLPIFDTAFLIFIRMLKSRSPLKKSGDHLALRFLKKGYSKKKTLLCMLGFGFICAFSGVLLTRANNAVGLTIFFFVLALSLLFAKNMSKVAVDG